MKDIKHKTAADSLHTNPPPFYIMKDEEDKHFGLAVLQFTVFTEIGFSIARIIVFLTAIETAAAAFHAAFHL